MTLETMGYIKIDNYYKKDLGLYTIFIFGTSKNNEFIRKITKKGETINIKKVIGVQSIERDDMYEEIFKKSLFKPENPVGLCGLERDKGGKELNIPSIPAEVHLNANFKKL